MILLLIVWIWLERARKRLERDLDRLERDFGLEREFTEAYRRAFTGGER